MFQKLLFYVPVGKAYSDLTLFQKKHDVNPLRGFLVPLVQVSLSAGTSSVVFNGCTLLQFSLIKI